jgi:DNA-directed RNA polymerase subunit beta'
MAFNDIGEIEHALAAKAITLHTKIKGAPGPVDAEGKRQSKPRSTPRLAA